MPIEKDEEVRCCAGFYKKDCNTLHFVSTIQHHLPLPFFPFLDSTSSPILSREMEVCRRLNRSSRSGEPSRKPNPNTNHDSNSNLTNVLIFTFFFAIIFFSVTYFLILQWREKIRASIPLYVVTLSEMVAIFFIIFSFIYITTYFGFTIQPLLNSRTSSVKDLHHHIPETCDPPPSPPLPKDDRDLVLAVVSGSVPSYSLESRLGDCRRAAEIRREAVQSLTGRSLEGLPVEGFDYESILGQCCEMPIGFVQIPVGVAGPLLLDEKEYTIPLATTEGCLVASTNRGCKAIHLSGGASSVLLRDAMTRAPVVRFGSAKRAAELKFFLEDPDNFDSLAEVFNK